MRHLLLSCALALAAAPLAAQQPEPPATPIAVATKPDLWKLRAGVSASVLYGNREQRILGTRGDLSRRDSLLELRAEVQTAYGEASTETEPRVVFKRLWLASLSADVRPDAPVSPFLFLTLESNLEKQIAGRYSAGVGAKRTFVSSDRSEVSLSLGMLAERLVPRETAGSSAGEVSLARWSLRGRLRHAMNDRVRLNHVTFWRPDARRGSQYLIQSQSEMEFKATKSVALTWSLLHNFDTEATSRGARTNTDGQMMFGATATF